MPSAADFQPEPDALKRCYLFVGNDALLMAEAFRRLRDAAVGDEDSPDIERFEVPKGLRGMGDGESGMGNGESEIGNRPDTRYPTPDTRHPIPDTGAPAEGSMAAELAAAAGTPALFSPRRLVVLRQALRLDAAQSDQLAKAIPRLPDYACVAIVCDPIPDGDRRAGERASGIGRKLSKAVEKVGEVVTCAALDKDTGRDGLIALARERGVNLPRGVASQLWSLCNQDFVEARAQLEKVMEYADASEGVTEEDVIACVLGSEKANVFVLVDAVADGKLGEALSQLDAILGSRKEEEAALAVVLPQLSRHYRLLWQARLLADEGVASGGWRELASDPRLPKEHNLGQAVAKTEWLARKYATQARRFSPAVLLEAFDLIARADMAMKGMEAGASTSDILGRLVVSLCGLVSGR